MNNHNNHLEVILIKNKGNKQLAAAFIIVLLCFLIAVKALSSVTTVIFKDEHNTVCIDPGHGGDAAGALSSDKKRFEKDDNLALSLKIKEKLEEKDVKVIMTRDDDSDVSLKDRCKKANKSKSDLFVAIHRNSSSDGTGMEVWIKDKPSKEEKRLAEDILNALVKCSGQLNRGVKKGYRNTSGNNYYVNANTDMPSCLVEVGFITNKEDNEKFDKLIDTYAQSIADAIYENIKKL